MFSKVIETTIYVALFGIMLFSLGAAGRHLIGF
jgi:hypothetical protein